MLLIAFIKNLAALEEKMLTQSKIPLKIVYQLNYFLVNHYKEFLNAFQNGKLIEFKTEEDKCKLLENKLKIDLEGIYEGLEVKESPEKAFKEQKIPQDKNNQDKK